ncbi:serine/threonine protein kinase [Fusarium proliferatum]|uniref:non-specific serine/threonine protein kinase n=1 Tax=Gibberella intermedia TaxID=948311 RepID=A0A365N1B5_GIBIN|nr:serine/threonine protein kinase [Fusarium proliferatum]
MARLDYIEICQDIRSQFTIKFEKAKTKDKFATRGLVRDILSRSLLETLYENIYDSAPISETGPNAISAYQFVRSIERKMLHDFLAVLLYAKCSINAVKIFTEELVFGSMAQEQQGYSETPYLLPATEDYLNNLFDRFDAQDFFTEQRPFCTIVLGGAGVVTIDQDDKRSLPWLDENHIGSGAFGSVYKVKIPKNHLTMQRDFNQTNSVAKLVARKDYRVAKNIEENFEKEVKSIREIFSSSSKHNNILESFGTLVIRGPEPKFSLLMPLADMDLQKYMERNPETPTDDRWARERIISATIGLAAGLEFLHSKMRTVGGDQLVCYHMDLKPSNVLVFLHEPLTEGTGTKDTKDRDYGMIWKLSDFGLSRVKTKTKPEQNLDSLFERKIIDQSTEASPTENHRGHSTYLPIEAQDKRKTMNQKSDIWSLGCVISVLFTYMEEGYSALEGYSNCRLKYSNKLDVFYQENRSNRGASLNDAVKSQHTKLIEAAKKRNAAEGEAVSSVLRHLESDVLVIDQSNRRDAESIVQCLGQALKKYQTAETMIGSASPLEKPYHLGRKLKKYAHGFNYNAWKLTLSSAFVYGLRKERSPVLPDIHRWRLDIHKSTRFKDCRSSPNGQLIAYWSEKAIMVFDRDTMVSRTNSSSTSHISLRITSTDNVRDRALRKVGEHLLTGGSCWKSLGLTDSYLVAVTIEAESSEPAYQCYVFDIKSDQTLQRYNKFTLPYPGFHSLAASPTEDAIACILNDNDQASLLTAVIDMSLPGPTTPSVGRSEAGISLIAQRPIVLDWPTSQIEHLALRTKNEGYIIVRGSSTLSPHLFTLNPPRMVKQNLILGSIGSSVERLFTDMVFFQSEADKAKSEVIVVAQAQRIFHLKFTGTSTDASSVVYLPVAYYRILKIATNGHVVVALGTHSGSNHLFLLEVKLSSPQVRPQLRKIAELKEVSTSCQPKLSVIGGWNEPIALITTATSDGQYLVYQKSLISLDNHNT